MRQLTTEGIIIKRKNVGEADKILTIFTPERGKVQAKAKGIRKITSRRSSSLELLNKSKISLYKGSGMSVVTEVGVLESYPLIKSNLERVYTAYHLCELIDGLCAEEQENSRVYALFCETLSRLGREKKLKDLISEFEIHLLTELGFWGREQRDAGTNAQLYIESLLERKLRSKNIYSKLL